MNGESPRAQKPPKKGVFARRGKLMMLLYILVAISICIPTSIAKYVSSASSTQGVYIASFHGGHVVHAAHDHFINQLSVAEDLKASAAEVSYQFDKYYMFNVQFTAHWEECDVARKVSLSVWFENAQYTSMAYPNIASDEIYVAFAPHIDSLGSGDAGYKKATLQAYSERVLGEAYTDTPVAGTVYYMTTMADHTDHSTVAWNTGTLSEGKLNIFNEYKIEAGEGLECRVNIVIYINARTAIPNSIEEKLHYELECEQID